MKLVYLLLYAATILMPGSHPMKETIVTGLNQISMPCENENLHLVQTPSPAKVIVKASTEIKEEAIVNKQSLPMILVVE